MGENGMEIKRDTFAQLDQKGQAAVLYDYLEHIVLKLDRLEKKKGYDAKKNMAVSAVTGFVGGFVAAFTNLFR